MSDQGEPSPGGGRQRIDGAGLSPLWVISLFLSLSETVLGIGVLNTDDGIQIALTSFVIGFPVLVGTAFFVVLWDRPEVFYRPRDFSGEIDTSSWREARRGRDESPEMIEIVRTVLKERIASEEVVSDAVEAIKREAFVRVDARAATGAADAIWDLALDSHISVAAFLDDVWFRIRDYRPVRPFTYGSSWVLKDASTGDSFEDLGAVWAKRNGFPKDHRRLSDIRIKAGAHLVVEMR